MRTLPKEYLVEVEVFLCPQFSDPIVEGNAV
jgi:hypothetical protein